MKMYATDFFFSLGFDIMKIMGQFSFFCFHPVRTSKLSSSKDAKHCDPKLILK